MDHVDDQGRLTDFSPKRLQRVFNSAGWRLRNAGRFLKNAHAFDDTRIHTYNSSYLENLMSQQDDRYEDIPAWDSPTVQDALGKMPQEDRWILERYLAGVKQRDIGEELGMCQGAVSYRLISAGARFKFWALMPPVPAPQVLERWLMEKLNVGKAREKLTTVVAFSKTYNQSRAAEALSTKGHRVRQCVVHQRLHSVLDRLIRSLKETDHQEPDLSELKAVVSWLVYVVTAGPFQIITHTVLQRGKHAHHKGKARLVQVAPRRAPMCTARTMPPGQTQPPEDQLHGS